MKTKDPPALELVTDENILKFRKPADMARTARKGRPPQPPIDWLALMNVDAVFLARPRIADIIELTEYHILYKGDKCVKVVAVLTDKPLKYWVDTKRFSFFMELVEILSEGTIDE